jgi:hypothetical protein
MEHSIKTLLVIVALGAAMASPAFARSELNSHQWFARSELNGHQQRLLPRGANISITNDRNLEGYPRPPD